MRTLPPSTIYGFNGTFPGPMINAEYGKPALVRFENHLDENPLNLDRQDFGAPDWSFLTHLHNGAHRAGERRQPALLDAVRPEAPGLPAGHVGRQPVPELAGRRRRPGEAELLLVPRPPDGPHRLQRLQGHGRAVPDLRPEERHGHGRRDARACGCPASAPTTRTARSTSTTTSRWRFFDCRLDDGVTIHQDIHDAQGEFPAAQQPAHAPGVVGQDVLQALPQPRLRRRHLHRQRHRLPGAGGQAAQVPLPLPGRLGRPDLRVQADELDQGPEDRGVARATPATSSRASTGSRTASSA